MSKVQSINNRPSVAMIGFGEAGSAFAEGWGQRSPIAAVYDKQLDASDAGLAMQNKIDAANLSSSPNASEAVQNKDVVFSFVTADQALAATQSAVKTLKPNALYFDCNSCAPDTKRQSAQLVEAAGARYVDVAIMAPVHPALHKTKVHISGPHTEAAEAVMKALDMKVTILEGDVGTASATKMVRSIMMKGLEALMLECVLAGREAGVDELVLDSLEQTYPDFGWKERAHYNLERVMVHGKRRAAEMREVATTVEQLGLPNVMSTATVNWQDRIGNLELDPNYELANEDYQTRADIILNALKPQKTNP